MSFYFANLHIIPTNSNSTNPQPPLIYTNKRKKCDSKWLKRKLLEINELYKFYEHQRTYLEKTYPKYLIILDKLGCFKKGDAYYIEGADRTEQEQWFLQDWNNIYKDVKQIRIKLIKLRDQIGIGLTSHIKLNYKQ